MIFTEILNDLKIDPKTLTQEELGTLENWEAQFVQKSITVDSIKDHLNIMIESVERELAGVKPPDSISFFLFHKKRERYLKARLYNYIILRDFINQPSKMLASIQSTIRSKKAQLSNKQN